MARILLIDDEQDVRAVIREFLIEAGHDVDEAENGEKGIALYEARPYDLIITDMLMPKLSGLELVSRLKQLDPGLKIIAISGGGEHKDLTYLKESGNLGVDHILTKPISPEHLFEFVDSCLEK